LATPHLAWLLVMDTFFLKTWQSSYKNYG